MYGLKKDKIISIRVNSKLLNKFNEIINANTNVIVYGTHKIYKTKFSSCGDWGKYSIADFLQDALLDFVNKNKID